MLTAGITGGFDYNRRVEYIIPRSEVEAGRCVRYVEVSSNGVFGTGGDPPEVRDTSVVAPLTLKDDKYYALKAVRLGAVNMEARYGLRRVWILSYQAPHVGLRDPEAAA